MLVMLRPDWPGDTFRRAGLEFQRANPIDVSNETLKSLSADLGKALVIVHSTTAKADHDATAEATADLDAFLRTTRQRVAVTDAASPAAPASAAPASAAPAPTTDTQTAAMVEPPPPRRKR